MPECLPGLTRGFASSRLEYEKPLNFFLDIRTSLHICNRIDFYHVVNNRTCRLWQEYKCMLKFCIEEMSPAPELKPFEHKIF